MSQWEEVFPEDERTPKKACAKFAIVAESDKISPPSLSKDEMVQDEIPPGPAVSKEDKIETEKIEVEKVAVEKVELENLEDIKVEDENVGKSKVEDEMKEVAKVEDEIVHVEKVTNPTPSTTPSGNTRKQPGKWPPVSDDQEERKTIATSGDIINEQEVNSG